MTTLAVVVLTRDEQVHLQRALSSVSRIAAETFVVDSYSTDGTVVIAERCGAKVLQNEFVNYAKQFQWALENAPITSEWVMRLDADEIIEPDLAVKITAELSQLPPDVTGVNLKRKHIFLGRWIRHGGRYPLVLLRIWRNGKAHIEDRWMDEHMVLTEGRAVTFDGGFADYNLNDLTFFTEKHNKYASREAVDVLNRRYGLFAHAPELSAQETSRQAAFKRFVKERIYNRIPFEIATLAYFFYRYVVQLGFLDGREGFAYHVLQGYWYRYLVGAKVRELDAAIRNYPTPMEKCRELARLTGLRLDEVE